MGPDVSTIDGGQPSNPDYGSVVRFSSSHELSVLDGFTITNGSGTKSGSSTYGGGIYFWSSSSIVTNNMIKGNSATAGGGIYCAGDAPTIEKNLISGNTGTWGGGALYLEFLSVDLPPPKQERQGRTAQVATRPCFLSRYRERKSAAMCMRGGDRM
jgi:hypothetical protein